MKQLIVKKYVFGNFISKYFELFVPNTRLKSSKDFVIYLNFELLMTLNGENIGIFFNFTT